MKLLIPILLLIAFMTDSVKAQVSQEWTQFFRGPGTNHDQVFKNTLDGSGNIYVLGSSVTSDFHSDIYLIKYSPSGQELWHKIFSSSLPSSLDIGYDMVVDQFGNAYIVGRSSRPGNSVDIPIIKYNSSGELVWNSWYNYRSDVGTSVCFDSKSNLIIAGYSGGDTIPGCYGVTLKYDTTGSMIWSKRFYMPYHTELTNAKANIDSLDNIYFVSPNNSFSPPINTQLLKYDSSGTLIWDRIYSNGYNEPFDMEVSKSGNTYVGGVKSHNNELIILLLKYDKNGNFVWERSLPSVATSDLQVAWDILLDENENIFFTGDYFEEAENLNLIVGKYNALGTQVWIKTYNGQGNGDDRGTAIATDSSGNLYVTGYSVETVSRRSFVTNKYDQTGQLLWSKLFTRGIEDAGLQIVLDLNNNIFVSGGSYGSNIAFDFDFATIKYSQTTGIHNTFEIPQTYSLSQNYPNPFNPETKIRFGIPKAGLTNLRVYDMLGREVSQLVNEELSPGIYEYSFNGTNLASGIYYYSIEAAEYRETKKMILVK